MKTKVCCGKGVALAAVLFAFIVMSSSVSAISMGAGPAKIFFGNLLRGGYAEQTIVTSTAGDDPLSVTVKIEGELAGWLTLNETDFTLPPKVRKEIKLTINPPADAANRMYSGQIILTAAPLGSVSGSGAAIGVMSILDVTADVSGIETVDYRILDAKVYETELGFPIEFYLKISNDGNVKVTPTIGIKIAARAEGAELHEFKREAKQMLPSRKSDDIVTIPSDNLQPGIQTVEIGYYITKRDSASGEIVESYVPFKTLSFNLLGVGALTAKGTLESIVLDKTKAGLGETIKINGIFKNQGTIMLRPKLDCEVLEGTSMLSKVDGKETLVQPGQSKTLEAYYTTIKEGDFKVKCTATFGAYDTEEHTTSFTVGGGGLNTTYIALGAVVLVIVFIAFKKGYLSGGGSGGGFEQ